MRGPRQTVNKAAETERQWGRGRQEITRGDGAFQFSKAIKQRDADQWKHDESGSGENEWNTFIIILKPIVLVKFRRGYLLYY